ncbi:TetR/AcrR family transcriptional regulator [Phytomonospora endophytica]|uniref:AcrR family transcriptional regulator n=1 Tax=Phytomonospora endophytica TaxID=714109 RepID=A0A841FF80_9ACTN|nr:TetR/AcrR family transcriptional regulator [Phytomonospora endophytica]MBB6032222.1 AcrR family transcriptional regulator [Phytomonospora endophytica]GIG68571.1 TetR family transcriptional regulator [Phytomonospora endophytica]
MPRIDRLTRADAILDTARELLLRHGYRKVSVDDVAKGAAVGKGTLYLHWRTREHLFLAVAAREAAAMTDAVAAAIAADPGEVALHRYMRRFFVEAMRRPVLRAVFTRDADTLDKLVADPSRRPLQGAKTLASAEYLALLGEAGLLRHDLSPAELDYTLPTVVYGFFAIEPFLPAGLPLDLDAKADRLADVLRRTFEPADDPGPGPRAAIAPRAAAVFTALADGYRVLAYGDDD